MRELERSRPRSTSNPGLALPLDTLSAPEGYPRIGSANSDMTPRERQAKLCAVVTKAHQQQQWGDRTPDRRESGLGSGSGRRTACAMEAERNLALQQMCSVRGRNGVTTRRSRAAAGGWPVPMRAAASARGRLVACMHSQRPPPALLRQASCPHPLIRTLGGCGAFSPPLSSSRDPACLLARMGCRPCCEGASGAGIPQGAL